MADNVNIVRLSTGEEIVCQMSIVENGRWKELGNYK